jgi:hypothetical protein
MRIAPGTLAVLEPFEARPFSRTPFPMDGDSAERFATAVHAPAASAIPGGGGNMANAAESRACSGLRRYFGIWGKIRIWITELALS